MSDSDLIVARQVLHQFSVRFRGGEFSRLLELGNIDASSWNSSDFELIDRFTAFWKEFIAGVRSNVAAEIEARIKDEIDAARKINGGAEHRRRTQRCNEHAEEDSVYTWACPKCLATAKQRIEYLMRREKELSGMRDQAAAKMHDQGRIIIELRERVAQLEREKKKK